MADPKTPNSGTSNASTSTPPPRAGESKSEAYAKNEAKGNQVPSKPASVGIVGVDIPTGEALRAVVRNLFKK
jgi:hypothetical protein